MRYDITRHHRSTIRRQAYDYAQNAAYFITICTQNRIDIFGDITNGVMRINDAGKMIERWWFELNHKFPGVTTDAFIVMPDHFHGIIIINYPIISHDATTTTTTTTAEAGVGADLRVRPSINDVRPSINDVRPLKNDVRPSTNDVRPSINDVRQNYELNGAHVAMEGAHVAMEGAHVAMEGAHVATEGAHAGAPLPVIIQWFKTMTTNDYIRGVKQFQWPRFPGKLWQRNFYEHTIRCNSAVMRFRRYIELNPGRTR